MRWQGGREITHEAFFCSLTPHTFKSQIDGLLHTPPSPPVLKEDENRGMRVCGAIALTPQSHYSWLSRESVTRSYVSARWLFRGPPWHLSLKPLKFGLQVFQAHVECIMFLTITLTKLSSNKELVREPTQIRKLTWAQQNRPQCLLHTGNVFLLLLDTVTEASPYVTEFFTRQPLFRENLYQVHLLLAYFQTSILLFFTAAFVTGKYSPPPLHTPKTLVILEFIF